MKRAKRLMLGFLALFSLSVPAQVWITNGSVGYYPFNGTPRDESGNGNGMVLHGATLGTNRFNLANTGYRFSAVGQWLSTTNHAGFPVSTNDFAVSLWVKLERLMASDYAILFANKYINSFQLNFSPFSASGTTLQFYTGNSGSNDGILCESTRTNLQSDTWYHVALVRQQNTILMYLNGIVIGQMATTKGNNAQDIDRDLDFGFRSATGHHQLYGQLDDVRIYNRSLSGAEVNQLTRWEDPTVVNIRTAAYLKSSTMKAGFNYQVQTSTNIVDWTDYGPIFTATNSLWESPDVWKVDPNEHLYFRLLQQ